MARVLDSHLDALAAALPGFRHHERLLSRWGVALARTLGAGGRLLVAGNGGSAEQAQHLAAELVGKLRDDRPALSAIALGSEPAAATAISNDYGYQEVFARQVRAHGRAGDVLLLLSTSGRSPNLLAAAEAAGPLGVRCWALTGAAPNPLAAACAEALPVASSDAQVVQELHLVAIHVLCAHVDRTLPALPVRPGGQRADHTGDGNRSDEDRRRSGDGGRPDDTRRFLDGHRPVVAALSAQPYRSTP